MYWLKTCGLPLRCSNEHKLIKLFSQFSSLKTPHVTIIVDVISIITTFPIISLWLLLQPCLLFVNCSVLSSLLMEFELTVLAVAYLAELVAFAWHCQPSD